MSVQQWSETVVLGELGDDPQFTDDLAAIVDQCTRDPRQDVLINLNAVNYLNSSNIAQLLKLRKLVMITNQRRLKLAGGEHASLGRVPGHRARPHLRVRGRRA
jgi:hypothetical protein